MLEKDYQLSAYKKLAAAGGMKTPGAITSARNSANTAKLLAEELTGLILDTIVYPDTITSYVSTIRTTTTGLTNIGELATKHADLLAGYADLSMLLQLDIGWDVYCRANEREVSELPISIAIGDVTITKSLEDAVNALNTSSLVAAMGEINQTIETMNKAEQHFHSQEVKNESEQAKYADRQMERKAEVQKQLVAAGNVRQRIPADTQRLLRESISEFNADADKG